ncbi:CAP domain-containing protein [Corynebacterium lowii]|uniref:Cysteine-rich secretory protein family protein n=1 Tax=Corynebacterium lowii TaxID=1544413 RepID=A0A0Q1AHK6_9CORY|nr:CAP domain-containing protein [Corynebacterium lowii]KQB86155.1 Cysteine-rich secretory protein family protein [Corynebacterium lowii]MDP9852630.1 uncharacterized protein YkwD [Corynebacterium lowii]
MFSLRTATKTLSITALTAALIATPAHAASAASCSDSNISDVVRLTNEYRATNGLSAVECDESMTRDSQKWADHMRKTGEFEHYNGGNFSENIDWRGGKATPNQVVNDWIESPGHRANMLDSDVSIIGVGWSQDPEKGTYAVQRFW